MYINKHLIAKIYVLEKKIKIKLAGYISSVILLTVINKECFSTGVPTFYLKCSNEFCNIVKLTYNIIKVIPTF